MSFVVQKKGLTLFDWINYSLVALISLACIFPFLYVFSVSFTDPKVYVPLKFYLFPEKWSLESYRYILSTNSFINAFKSTLFITVVGTILNIIVSFTMAYGLTKRSLPGHKWIMGLVIFTLVFSAGIIPNYLLVKELGLLNSYWSMILPGLTNAWSLIVIKSFLESLPSELEDAAQIDGCSDLTAFFRIIVPLSMPAIATFTLFFAVGHWNAYFNALIYLSDSSKWTLQLLIKTLVIDSNSVAVAQAGASDESVVPQETIRMASIVLAMVPILIVYPFLQKHFAKGVMIGSVKG
ncbi:MULTISPECIES: carbohydrate ABC transporter permease [Paenibacillus]|uniref:Binding-protein-dependent transport systems inner membrane component n=1 Tax=Paenibacillus illinoisensis TaxID=59845 RepID=A0A2W0D5U7_9BACL|nr:MULTISPECIES: carbohydrate ABC transporter permease [Paenibacillus]MBM6386234.1 carbohydrate ABC transporter permease [Paenibacillus sp.]MBE7681314.1 ABC transporter permease subunit [Paenibacillus sp. P13VS]MBY0216014.1 carbohydrate ABC transporter permease [Paenibacillus illinoisensis]MCM3204158.1 carbohydrate ABC transporter permease [Paenibacillus illinoisensis]PAD29324.1 ABC transporter permease [Paenibacillus sp. 7523-1]